MNCRMVTPVIKDTTLIAVRRRNPNPAAESPEYFFSTRDVPAGQADRHVPIAPGP